MNTDSVVQGHDLNFESIQSGGGGEKREQSTTGSLLACFTGVPPLKAARPARPARGRCDES
jgi:hypothetical protein